MSTQDTGSDVTPTSNDNTEHLKTLEDLLVIGNTAQLENIQKDRCLLRRDTRLAQNKQWKLGGEDKQKAAEEMCEDDEMKISIDRSTKITHNHIEEPEPEPTPTPQPQPSPVVRIPWWLIVMAVLPLILLLAVLVGWFLSRQPEPTPVEPVAWQLDIGAEDPVTATPATVSGIDKLRERKSAGENADD